MFNVTEEDIKDLIRKYNEGEEMPYKLEHVLKCGLKYIYGEIHYKNGKVDPCETNFGDFIQTSLPHKCKSNFVKTTIKKLGIADSLFSCWTGDNIAIMSGNSTLYAYYKTDLLFEAQMKDISAMAASNTKIYMGTYDGNLIHYDPLSQSENIQKRHSGTITSIKCIETESHGNYVLSCSTDGSIFFRKNIKIADCEILDSIYIQDNCFVSACNNNSISLYKSGEIKSFLGHRSRINSLSFDNVIISSSSDGYLGMLSIKNEPVLEMKNLGCSLHKPIGGGKILGFGLENLKIYDIEKDSALLIQSNQKLNSRLPIESADLFNSLLVYAIDGAVNFCDIRTKEKFCISTGGPIKNIEFNSTGDLLFISSDDGPSMIELRNVKKN